MILLLITLTTTKMNAEVEAHKETKESLDRTLAQLAEIQGSVDEVKKEYLEMIKEGVMDHVG